MKMKPSVFGLVLLLTYVSCNRNSESLNFNDHSVNNGEKIHASPNLCINGIIASDSILLVLDWCSDSSLFYAYSYHPFELVGCFGLKGVGPNEFISPFYSKNIVPKESGLLYSVFDLNRKLLGNYHISWKPEIGLLGTFPDSLYKIPTQVMPSMNLSISNSTFIGNGLNSEEGLFYIYDNSNYTKNWIDFRPKMPNLSVDGITKSYLYTNKVIANHQKSRIACGMKFFNKIHFYNDDGSYIKTVSFGESVFPQPGNNMFTVSSESCYYVLDLYGTEEYLYVLWSGFKQDDFNKKAVNGSTVIVLDWKGNYIKSLKIPRSVLIATSPSNSTMFSASYDLAGNLEIRWYDIDL